MSEPNTIGIDAMSREELIARARELSINRPELMTRVELRDEIIRLTETDEERRKRARGWLGVARDLVASVVEQRLNLPDAAELIRGANLGVSRHVPPVATVTLAEIYAAQGHLGRAIKLLDEVLLREPDHVAAAALRVTLIAQQAVSKAEPAVRQSDMPEPHDTSEPWEGDPIAAESADNAPAEAEAMAAAEEVNEAESTIVETATQSEISGVASVTSTSSRDEATEPRADVAARPWGASEGDEMVGAGELPISVEASHADLLSGRVEHGESVTLADSVSSRVEYTESVTLAESWGVEHSDSVLLAEASGVEHSDSVPLAEASGVEHSDSVPLADQPPQLKAVPEAMGAACDELLLYRRSGRTLVCHWEIQRDTWEQWQASQDGEWVLRLFQAKAVEGPLESEERDVSLPGMSGEVLSEIEPNAHVRLAVGWKSAERFQPVVIGVEVAGDVPESLQLAWRPLPSVDDPPAEFWLQQACQYWHVLSVSGS